MWIFYFLAALMPLLLPASAPEKLPNIWLEISVRQQELHINKITQCAATYSISTAQKGLGQRFGSYQTPIGWHRIKEKIGKGVPLYTVFRAKRSTHEKWNPQKATRDDLVLTRILVLEGLEPGINRGFSADGECVDSYSRSIYIHGTAEEHLIGSPTSHGCIRMKNRDIIEFFDKIPLGTYVWIHQ